MTVPSCALERDMFTADRMGIWPTYFQMMTEASAEAVTAAGLTTRIARHPTVFTLNRYKDVLPWDQSRVKLKEGSTDYINASYVSGERAGFPDLPRHYILTQAPLDATVPDFWHMIWEQKSRAIVMLNNVVEMGKVKCSQYWPLGAKNGDTDGYIFQEYGYEVMLLGEDQTTEFVRRRLLLTKTSTQESREISQLHFVAWPDFGVPPSATGFLKFLKEVRRGGAFETGAGPPIVHCSAGIGRSGTFVVVDALLLLIEAQPKRRWDAADVHNLLLGLRLCRMGLVQTFDQYRFCFQAVVDEGKQFMEIYQRKAILPTELITSGASQIDQSKYANIASSSTSNPKAVMSRNSLEQNTRSKTQGSRPEIQPAPRRGSLSSIGSVTKTAARKSNGSQDNNLRNPRVTVQQHGTARKEVVDDMKKNNTQRTTLNTQRSTLSSASGSGGVATPELLRQPQYFSPVKEEDINAHLNVHHNVKKRVSKR